jgi:hypothetical protein
MARQPLPLAREVTERLLSYQHPDERPADFARRLGITPQVLNGYLNNGATVSTEKLVEILRHAPWINARFVLTGEEARSDDEAYRRGMREAVGAFEDLVRDLRARYG